MIFFSQHILPADKSEEDEISENPPTYNGMKPAKSFSALTSADIASPSSPLVESASSCSMYDISSALDTSYSMLNTSTEFTPSMMDSVQVELLHNSKLYLNYKL